MSTETVIAFSDVKNRLFDATSRWVKQFALSPDEIWLGPDEYKAFRSYCASCGKSWTRVSHGENMCEEFYGLTVRRSVEPGVRVGRSIEV